VLFLCIEVLSPGFLAVNGLISSTGSAFFING
jgi:hypothetical protein